MSQTITGVVKHHYDTASNLSSSNPTPLAGELVIESDTGLAKFGDGTTAYNSLGYHVITRRVTTVSSTSTLSIAVDEYVIADTSGGSITLTLPSGEYDGQIVSVECDGTGLAYVKGAGVYLGASSLGTPVSDGLKGTWTWNGTAWIADNEVTAEFNVGGVSGQFVRQWARGWMENTSYYVGTTTTIAVTYNVPFTSAFPYPVLSNDGAATSNANIQNALTTSYGLTTNASIQVHGLKGGNY